MKIRDFLPILIDEGFKECRPPRGTHHYFEAVIGGVRRLVTVDYAQMGQDIKPRNLASMIKQSGLPKKRFR